MISPDIPEKRDSTSSNLYNDLLSQNEHLQYRSVPGMSTIFEEL